jgi:antirestriction protein ArdC
MPRKQSGSRYVEATDRIIEALQKGVVPWERPWVIGQPLNAETGRRYRGINRLLLDFTAL